MKSHARLWGLGLIALGSAAIAQQEPAGDGPRGSSQLAPGEVRYDEVGYAGLAELGGVSVASSALPPGSYVEVTALDSGRTILAVVTGSGAPPARLVALSPGAARALGVAREPAPVRVRRVTPGPQDSALLSAGQAASERADAPDALLVPLRKRLARPPAATAPAVAVKPATPPPPAAAKPAPPRPAAPAPTRPAATGRYYVQVAALSNRDRAEALARSLGGGVEAAGSVYRVRLGPYSDAAAAAQGRAAAARKGYPDARVVRPN